MALEFGIAGHAGQPGGLFAAAGHAVDIFSPASREFECRQPCHDFQPGTAGWKRYDETLALLGLDLGEMLLEWASPDWYARWFVEGATPKGGYGRKGDDESTEDTEAAADASAEAVPQETVDAMRAKLQGARTAVAEASS